MQSQSKILIIGIVVVAVIAVGFFLFFFVGRKPAEAPGVPPQPSVGAPPAVEVKPSDAASVIDAFTQDAIEELSTIEGENDSDLFDLDSQNLNELGQSYDETVF